MKLRTLGKFVAGVIALVMLALITIPLFISADFLKGQLVAQVKKATGRDLVINGNASLVLFPNIAVSVEDVTLGNPSGFVSPYFVHIDKLETGAALKPLLSKELQITGLTLEGMQLNLEENGNGAKNWEFTLEKAKDETQQSLEKKEKGAAPKNFTLGDILIRNSVVNYTKANTKPMVIRDLDLTLVGADGSKPLTVDSKLLYQNEPASVQLKIQSLKSFLDGSGTAVGVNMVLPYGNTLGFNGKASFKDQPAASGALTAEIADLPKLVVWGTGKPAVAGVPKQIHLQTKLAATSATAFTLNEMVLKVDNLAANGKLSINLDQAVPALNGTLKLGELDLNQLMSADKNAPATASATAPSATRVEGWSEKAIDASALRTVNANLDLAIDTLRSNKLEITKIATNLALKGGVLKVNLANASLYDGAAKGTVTLDGSSSAVGIATDLSLNHVQIDPLMTALSGTSRLQGVGNVRVALNGRGASERTIVSSLNGNGSLTLNDGAIKGVNIAQFFRSAKKGFLFAEDASEATDFSEMSASYTIKQGVLTNTDLAMKSPILRVTGSGSVNLLARSLNYRLVPTVVGTLKGQGGDAVRPGISIPLVITGPWNNPSVTPDIGGMIQEGLKNPEALKQNLKDIKNELKNYNSPKDIGRALLGGGAKTEPAAAPAEGEAAPEAKPSKEDALKQSIGGLLNSFKKKEN